MRLKIIHTFILLVFYIGNVAAQSPIVSISHDSTFYPLGTRIDILGYKGKALSIQEILSPSNQKRFERSQQISPNHGFSTLNYWFKLRIAGKAKETAGKEWLLQMKNPNIDTLDVYFLNEKNEIIQEYHTGDRLPFAQRPIVYYKFSFPIPFEKSETFTVYIHARGFYAKGHDLVLIEETALFNESQYGLAFAIFLNTILIALVLYNLLLYISLRDISYFYYIIYLSCTAIHLISTTGLGYQFVYPEYTTFANYVANSCATLGGSFTLLFSYHFLKIKTLLPVWVHWVVFSFIGYGFFIFAWIIVALWSPWYIPYIMTCFAIQLLATLLLVIVLGTWTLRKGLRSAIFFLAAWAAMFVGTSLSIVRVLGFDVPAFFSDFGVQIGTSLEALLLSFGLADRIKIIEKEKIEAQKTTIKALRETEEIIREQNQLLEQKVKERTQELADVNEDLASFNAELNQANEDLQATLGVVNQQKQDIEDKNQAILDSIMYAKRIQDAILPTQEKFEQYLPDSFIFFRPRDIVSGDFYFLEEKNNCIILAVVDCTGHGVPGALMSMIGKELLDQIIVERAILEADIIINELHKGIRKALKQQESENRDGMDLSLIVMDKANQEAQYAGAKSSLLYIQDGIITRIKGDNILIGGEQLEQERVFTKHMIPLSQTTHFYLFTDGFQDQFGGSADKKFSFTQLKELFLKIHQEDMATQQAIVAETFTNWAGYRKQIDDVLIIGAKI